MIRAAGVVLSAVVLVVVVFSALVVVVVRFFCSAVPVSVFFSSVFSVCGSWSVSVWCCFCVLSSGWSVCVIVMSAGASVSLV